LWVDLCFLGILGKCGPQRSARFFLDDQDSEFGFNSGILCGCYVYTSHFSISAIAFLFHKTSFQTKKIVPGIWGNRGHALDGPEADFRFPQVTLAINPEVARQPLLFARPTVTFPASERRCPCQRPPISAAW